MRRTSPSNVFTNIKRIFFIAAILYNSAIPFTAAAQGWKWATGSSCINGLAETGPIAVDKSGNVYEIGFIGYFPGETSTITSVFGPFTVVDTGHLNGQGILVSTDSNGAYRWVIASNGYADFANVVTDPYGNIYILGVFNYYPSFTFGGRSFTGSGNFVIKVASTGNVLWIKNIGSNFAMGSKISISRAGNIYIGGVFNAPVTIGATTLTNTDISGTTSDVFYAAYDSSMNPLWVKSFGGTGNDYLSDMVVANDSDVYIAGYFRSAAMTIGSSTLTVSTAGPQPFYVAKFTSNGSPLWASKIAANDTFDFLNRIAVDDAGSVYLTGYYQKGIKIGTDSLHPSGVALYAMFLAKFDSSGNTKWGRADDHCYYGVSIAADACGNIWVGGSSATLANPDGMFLTRYDSAGHLVDTLFLTVGGDDQGANPTSNISLAVDGKGSLYVGGDYQFSNTVIGSDTLKFIDSPSVTEEATFILKYKYDTAYCIHDTLLLPTQQAIPLSTSGITLYPNPATEECTIQSATPFAAGAQAWFYDVTRRLIGKYGLSGNVTTIPLSGFKPGIYQCRIFNNGHLMETKKLVIMK